MKAILPVVCLLLSSALAAFSQTEPKAVIRMDDFLLGCEVYMRTKTDEAYVSTAREQERARMALGFVGGYFAAAVSIQRSNPDIRLLDPRWKEAKIADLMAVICQRIDQVNSSGEKNPWGDMLPEHFLGVVMRCKEGSDLEAPR